MDKVTKYTVVGIVSAAAMTIASGTYCAWPRGDNYADQADYVRLCSFIGWFIYPYIVMLAVMWLFRNRQRILTGLSIGVAIVTVLGMCVFLDAVFLSRDAPIGLALVPVCQLIAVLLLSIVCLVLKKFMSTNT